MEFRFFQRLKISSSAIRVCVRMVALWLACLLVPSITPPQSNAAVDVGRACALDFSFIGAGVSGKDYVEYLRTWDFSDEEAAAILLHPELQKMLFQILPGANLHRGYVKRPELLDLAKLAVHRLETGIEKAPAGWAEKYGIKNNVDLVYTRWKMLEMTGIKDQERLYYLARALATEPIMVPRSLTMNRRDFKEIARTVVRSGVTDAVDLDLLVDKMPFVLRMMKGKRPPRSESKRREYLMEYLIEDALNLQTHIRDTANREVSVEEIMALSRESYSRYGFPEPMVEQMLNATAYVYLGIPPPTAGLQKRILDALRGLVRSDFRILRENSRILLAAEAERDAAIAAEAAEAAARQAPPSAIEAADAAPVDKAAQRKTRPPMGMVKRRRQRVAEDSPQRVFREDRAPGSDVPRAQYRNPPPPEESSAAASNADNAAARNAARPPRIDPHPRQAITRRGFIVDTNILIALQLRKIGVMDDNRGYMLSNFGELIGEYNFETGGRVYLPDRVIKETRGDMSVAGNFRKIKLSVRRDSRRYKAMMTKLEELQVGIPPGETVGGEADRQILADIFFAERANPEVTPTFYTADANIFRRMCAISPDCIAAGSGANFFRNLRNGYNVRIRVSETETVSLRIVPVPSGRDIFSPPTPY